MWLIGYTTWEMSRHVTYPEKINNSYNYSRTAIIHLFMCIYHIGVYCNNFICKIMCITNIYPSSYLGTVTIHTHFLLSILKYPFSLSRKLKLFYTNYLPLPLWLTTFLLSFLQILICLDSFVYLYIVWEVYYFIIPFLCHVFSSCPFRKEPNNGIVLSNGIYIFWFFFRNFHSDSTVSKWVYAPTNHI